MGAGGQESFLVVEDDARVARALTSLLNTVGRAYVAPTLSDAVAVAERDWIGAIIDIALPDGTGFDALRALRRHHANLPAVILSGAVDHERLVSAHELGAGYLLKPSSGAEIQRFAQRAWSPRADFAAFVDDALSDWEARYCLSVTEVELLRLAAHGEERKTLHERRQVQPCTIKKQLASIADKTQDTSFETAIVRLLRIALKRVTDPHQSNR